MTDKELFKKLDSLKSLKPDSQWKSGQRELLLSQVSASGVDFKSGFFVLLKNFFASMPQPALIGSMIIVFIFGGLVYGGKQYGKPDNSLYIARTLYERLRVSTSRNEARPKVEASIAASRAQDIVTAMTKNDVEKNEKLNEDLKVEIQKIKDQLEVFSASAEKDPIGIEVAEERATNTPSVIEEAEKLVEEKNYEEALIKLQQASEMIK